MSKKILKTFLLLAFVVLVCWAFSLYFYHTQGHLFGNYYTQSTSQNSGGGTVNVGTTGQFPFYNGNGQTLTATTTMFMTQAGLVGFGTTSPVSSIDIYTSVSSSTPLLLESVSGGGCILVKDVKGAGYSQIYTQAGVTYTKVHTGSLTTCN